MWFKKKDETEDLRKELRELRHQVQAIQSELRIYCRNERGVYRGSSDMPTESISTVVRLLLDNAGLELHPVPGTRPHSVLRKTSGEA